jgi:hypothetical protein
MSAIDRLVELEKRPPKTFSGVKVRTIATIRLDNSPVYEYIEVEIGGLDNVVSARLYDHHEDSISIPYGGKLWAWVEETVASEI